MDLMITNCQNIFSKKDVLAGKLPQGKTVENIGLQNDGSWVLGQNIYIGDDGEAINPNDSSSIWIINMYFGLGITSPDSACTNSTPTFLTSVTSVN